MAYSPDLYLPSADVLSYPITFEYLLPEDVVVKQGAVFLAQGFGVDEWTFNEAGDAIVFQAGNVPTSQITINRSTQTHKPLVTFAGSGSPNPADLAIAVKQLLFSLEDRFAGLSNPAAVSAARAAAEASRDAALVSEAACIADEAVSESEQTASIASVIATLAAKDAAEADEILMTAELASILAQTADAADYVSGGIDVSDFASAPASIINIAAGTTGFSAPPAKFVAWVECVVADDSYEVGDVLPLGRVRRFNVGWQADGSLDVWANIDNSRIWEEDISQLQDLDFNDWEVHVVAWENF